MKMKRAWLAVLVVCLSCLSQPIVGQDVSRRSQRTPFLVAASNAPANVRAVARYLCDGINDEVQIQAAIDTAIAYGSGGVEVVLSPGIFYVGSPQTPYSTGTIQIAPGATPATDPSVVTLTGGTFPAWVVGGGGAYLDVATIHYYMADATHITTPNITVAAGTAYVARAPAIKGRGGMTLRGAGTHSTNINASADNNLYSMDSDVIAIAPASTQGFFTLEGVYINGNRMYAAGTGGTQLGCIDQITGITKAHETDANGIIYVSIITDDGGTNYHLHFYNDSARAVLIGTSATWTGASTTPALKAITAEATYHIGGNIGVVMGSVATTASTSIILRGNIAGNAIFGNTKCWDTHIRHMMVMNAAQDGIRLEQPWGAVIDDCVVEFCYGNGVSLLSTGGNGKVSGCKIMENSGHGIFMAAANCILSNIEADSSMSADVGLHVVGKAAIYGTGSDCTISNCRVGARKGNDGIHLYSAARSAITGCYAAGQASGTSNCGFKESTATNNTWVGCTAYNIVTGFNLVGSSATACVANTCTTGFTVGGHEVSYDACRALTCTTGFNITYNRYRVSNCKLDTCTTGILVGAASVSPQITNNQVHLGTTGISLTSGAGTTGNGLIANNVFSGQTGNAWVDNSAATGLLPFRNNTGCPNYEAGRLVAQATSTTLTKAAHYGATVVVTADAQAITLPASTGTRDRYTIVNGVKDAGALLTVTPDASGVITKIGGTAMAADESYLNTKATAKCGDYVTVEDTGTDAWRIVAEGGIWAEATP